MNKATFMGIVKVTPRSDARVFMMSPPLEGHEFVCVSAANMEEMNAHGHGFGFSKTPPETLIFPCSPAGDITGWIDLGGYRGGLSHAVALERVGYEIEEGEDK